MTDNLKDRGPRDQSRVNLLQYHEVLYWSKKFNCSTEDLRKAVAKVGSSADAVEHELKAKPPSP